MWPVLAIRLLEIQARHGIRDRAHVDEPLVHRPCQRRCEVVVILRSCQRQALCLPVPDLFQSTPATATHWPAESITRPTKNRFFSGMEVERPRRLNNPEQDETWSTTAQLGAAGRKTD